jgi:hypothetical protein
MVGDIFSRLRKAAFRFLPAVAGLSFGCATAPHLPPQTAETEAVDYIRRNHGSVMASASTEKLPLFNITVKQHTQVTGVRLPADRLTDEAIEQLLKLDSLRSITLLGRQPPAPDDDGPISLPDAKTPASPEAIANLENRFPGLLVYATPLSEFSPIR